MNGLRFSFTPSPGGMMETQDPYHRLAASRRVLVLGSSGSGKTTFSRKLADILRLETIHLDALFWQPGWIATGQPEWREQIGTLIQRESWVMDGTYESTLDLRIPAADSIVVLECSRWRCLWRVLKRKALINDRRRPDAPSGQRLDRAFLSYIWRYPATTQPLVRERIDQFGPDKLVIELRGSRDVQACLRQTQKEAERRVQAI